MKTQIKISMILFFLVSLMPTLLRAQTVSGELKRWHKVSLTFDGPNTSETATPNPFSDYNLEVLFTHASSGVKYKVPGFFAACGDADESSCNSGNKWRVHFAPNLTGRWNWQATFKTGSNVAINGGGVTAGFMDGDTGFINITESNKSGRDFRNKENGRLVYVGEHYLRFSGTTPRTPNGKMFFKVGADSPENAFAYEDFDATPNEGNRRKSWSRHQQDYVATDASSYTWNNGKGTELLGVINYLHKEGANVMSFLTFNAEGDDENVFPHLIKGSVRDYENLRKEKEWDDGLHHDRFDVSKMDQWENIFEYADKKGVYLHFKTLETENDRLMDNGNNGRERKLYYRELIARFAHHLALNWNMGEETKLSANVNKGVASYIKSIDPYENNIVLHTFPHEKDRKYDPLLGNASELTGVSLQTNVNDVHNDVKKWIQKSKNSGKKWVVANDEQGTPSLGVRISDKDVRKKVLYGTMMAGGAGVEYYYGYTKDDGDLNNQDHRKRGVKYKEAGYAVKFFDNYLQEYVVGAVSDDGITSDNNDFVLANPIGVYAIYRPNGGSTNLSLPSGNSNYTVQWFNPRSGEIQNAVPLGSNLVAPDSNDWVAFIKLGSTGPVSVTGVSIVPTSLTIEEGTTGSLVANVLPFNATNKTVSWSSNNDTVASINQDGLVTANGVGSAIITVTTEEGDKTATSTITVVDAGSQPITATLSPIHDAYLQGTTGFNNTIVRVEPGKRVGYFQFDLSNIKGSITEAKLKLTCDSDSGSGNINIELGDSNSWTESNLSNGNKPSSTVLLGSLNSSYSIGRTYTWNLDGSQIPTNGMVSIIVSQTDGNDVAFASKESSSMIPQLEISYLTAIGAKNSLNKHDETLFENVDAVAYPNPFRDRLSILLGNKDNKDVHFIKVTSLDGRVVYKKNLTNNENKFDLMLENNKNGIYIVTLVGKKDTKIFKVIKKN
ncbi:hypothetical protein A8C32_06850 [Flavivirga aquatica]|uniref:BIG2 domain-containing protein n=1 Tax=Flavivirga aquatica TaxID=1849968 RepID=A0A1E5SIF9_9FLAO|nr:DUF5060 domain-containing protein [Flavivirga aquatica]OEJ98901.1 hypothetical protein A8C32_06850 [Flavivirga aquatica]